MQRSKQLSIEESRLARMINKAREDAQTTILSIENEYTEYKNQRESEKRILQAEVAELENKRRELMRPIEELKTEAQTILDRANQSAGEVQKQAQGVEANREKNLEFAEALADRSDDLNVIDNKLKQKDSRLAAEERRLAASAKTLGSEWLKLSTATHETNLKTIVVAQKESQLAAREKALETNRIEINTIQQQISSDRKAIQDGYASLAAARKEILGRDT